MRKLEHQIQTFGSHLQPYAKERAIDADLFFEPEAQSVNCAVCFAFYVIGSGTGVMTEQQKTNEEALILTALPMVL